MKKYIFIFLFCMTFGAVALGDDNNIDKPKIDEQKVVMSESNNWEECLKKITGGATVLTIVITGWVFGVKSWCKGKDQNIEKRNKIVKDHTNFWKNLKKLFAQHNEKFHSGTDD